MLANRARPDRSLSCPFEQSIDLTPAGSSSCPPTRERNERPMWNSITTEATSHEYRRKETGRNQLNHTQDTTASPCRHVSESSGVSTRECQKRRLTSHIGKVRAMMRDAVSSPDTVSVYGSHRGSSGDDCRSPANRCRSIPEFCGARKFHIKPRIIFIAFFPVDRQGRCIYSASQACL